MRAIHLFIASAVLVLGASLVSIDRAPAQLQLQAGPPADSASRIGQPIIEDVKFEADTAQPPKAGSAVFFDRGVLTPRKKARTGAAGIKAK